MSKTTPRRSFGRGTGTVTVIKAQVHRSSERNARFAFIITAITVGLVAMVVAAERMHPLLAFFVGALIGVPTGGIVWTLVRVWPVIRVIWWWIIEIFVIVTAAAGWVQLAEHTTAPVTLAVLALVIGVPAAVPGIRRRVIALGWCVIVRHRLRVCFAQFIIANQSGSLPLMLWARPTPVGERVWVYLRPGLSLPDLHGRLDKIAVACHATSALVERATDGNAAYLRFDIKRREVLTADVGTPLTQVVSDDTPKVPRQAVTVPTALDLPDVLDQPIPLATAAKSATSTNGKKPPLTSVKDTDAGGDVNDWL